jgi:hypothetical protein
MELQIKTKEIEMAELKATLATLQGTLEDANRRLQGLEMGASLSADFAEMEQRYQGGHFLQDLFEFLRTSETFEAHVKDYTRNRRNTLGKIARPS